MTVDEILSFWALNAGTTTAQVWATNALLFANIVYHELEEAIRNEINEDYFYDYFTTDTVANQTEYVLQAQTSSSAGINKIISVGIKYATADTTFSPLRPYTSSGLYDTEEWTITNQSQGDPFYIVKDNSIFIYPAPTVAVDDGLRVHASVNLVNLLAGWAESTVKIPVNFHYVIAKGMKRYIGGMRSLDGLAKYWDGEYEMAKQALLNYLRNRTSSPIDQDSPRLTSLMY
jgi:hypothetical protein